MDQTSRKNAFLKRIWQHQTALNNMQESELLDTEFMLTISVLFTYYFCSDLYVYSHFFKLRESRLHVLFGLSMKNCYKPYWFNLVVSKLLCVGYTVCGS